MTANFKKISESICYFIFAMSNWCQSLENKITKNVNSDDLINRLTDKWENSHDQSGFNFINKVLLFNELYKTEPKIYFLPFVCLCCCSCITVTLLHFIGNTYIIFKAKFSIFSRVLFPYFSKKKKSTYYVAVPKNI